MVKTSRTIEVAKPLSDVFRQWWDLENLSQYVPQIVDIRRINDQRSHWVVEAMGMRQEWDAEITDVEPDRRIEWRSTSGFRNTGQVVFDPLGPDRTRISITFEYELPEPQAEQAADEVQQALEEGAQSVAL